MGQLTKDLIENLRQGGDAARDSLFRASELLRKTRSTGFTPCFLDLVHEKVTDAEVVALVDALANFYENETLAPSRRGAVRILASDTDTDAKEQLVRELHLTLTVHRQISADLYQLLLGLSDSEEKVYPADSDSVGVRSISQVQINVEAASDYLYNRHGIRVPW